MKENIKAIQENISQSQNRVKLVAVTKGIDPEKINEAIKYGITCIGENRVQEAEMKLPYLKSVEKHFIGKLQSNKVKKAVQLFDCIQSVDSVKLAKAIDDQAYEYGKIMSILLEINIAGEKSKSGVYPEEMDSFIEGIRELHNIQLEGLMTIAPIDNPEPYFSKMKTLFKGSGLRVLSMGMSDDYLLALKHGSNMVRIGRAIFK